MQYHQNLRLYSIDDRCFSSSSIKTNSNILLLIVALPLYLLGTIIWWIPGNISKWIADKTVTRIDFYTSVYNGVLGFMGLIWWVLWQLVFWFSAQKLLWFLMFVSPAFCFAALEWIDCCARQKAEMHFKLLNKKDAAFVDQMKQMRKEILFG